MKWDIVAVITAATAVIGFLSIWVKMGVEKGESKKSVEQLEKKVAKNESDIAELKNTTHNIQIEIAKFMGKIEAKLDAIQETIADLKPKGGRRAPEK